MADAGYAKAEIDASRHVFRLFEKDSSVLWSAGNGVLATATRRGRSGVRPGVPVSFFCLNDYIARGVYDAASEMELKIGRDIFIVGFDDLAIASRLRPALSSVRQDFAAMGYRAAALLDTLAPDAEPVDMRIPVELIIPESSGEENVKAGERT
jgi:DNA-binding LacI/PurR family transcriptional regulator